LQNKANVHQVGDINKSKLIEVVTTDGVAVNTKHAKHVPVRLSYLA
jgi:hypothetical protein